jgi:hypothetical protein
MARSLKSATRAPLAAATEPTAATPLPADAAPAAAAGPAPRAQPTPLAELAVAAPVEDDVGPVPAADGTAGAPRVDSADLASRDEGASVCPEQVGPMKVVRRAPAERKRLPPVLEAFAAGDTRVLRAKRTTPRLDDPRTVYLIPGVANRHARLVYDRRLEALREAVARARSHEEARPALGALLADALRLGWWRGRSLTGFDALVEGVLGLPVDEAEALARAACDGQLPERMPDHAVALVLRAEAGIAEAGVAGQVLLLSEPTTANGPPVPVVRLEVPVHALAHAVVGAAQLLRPLAMPVGHDAGRPREVPRWGRRRNAETMEERNRGVRGEEPDAPLAVRDGSSSRAGTAGRAGAAERGGAYGRSGTPGWGRQRQPAAPTAGPWADGDGRTKRIDARPHGRAERWTGGPGDDERGARGKRPSRGSGSGERRKERGGPTSARGPASGGRGGLRDAGRREHARRGSGPRGGGRRGGR